MYPTYYTYCDGEAFICLHAGRHPQRWYQVSTHFAQEGLQEVWNDLWISECIPAVPPVVVNVRVISLSSPPIAS